MLTTKRLVQTAGLAAGVIAAVASYQPDTPVGRAARRLADRLARDVRYAAGTAPGLLYRLGGRRPDPFVTADILADRIRSSLGPLEKRLDIPRVHVMVEDQIAILHGEVPSEREASAVEHAILRISGVEGVESHLHTGLASGSTRPSEGAAAPEVPSDALRALLDAARGAGAASDCRAAVRSVLCTFADRIPEREWAHLLAHLPADVRALIGPVRRHGARSAHVKTLPQLVAAASADGAMLPQCAEDVTRAVIAALRELVPEERRDIAAVLPVELREFWQTELAR